MVEYASLALTRSLIHDPTLDISHVRGNVTDEAKQLASQVFYYFVSTRERSYGADIGQRLKLVEVNVREQGDGPDAPSGETIFEIEVEKGEWIWKFLFCFNDHAFLFARQDMCNIFGTLHGACAAYMVDP